MIAYFQPPGIIDIYIGFDDHTVTYPCTEQPQQKSLKTRENRKGIFKEEGIDQVPTYHHKFPPPG
jgi:hypothetical protein